MNKPAIQSVANAFSVLEYVLSCSMISEGTELADIAKKFGMQKSTARNMMQTLEYCGYIRRTARGIYSAGEKCAMLSKAGRFAGQLRERSLASLKQAAEKTGESFILTTLFNGQRLIIASVSGRILSRRMATASVSMLPFVFASTVIPPPNAMLNPSKTNGIT